jgi:7-cyano-7-deazaguanine synthase
VSSIVLLSGGLDSAVSLKCALDAGPVALALTFNYGQKAAAREIAAARAMCGHFQITHRDIPLPWLAEITRTALVAANQEVPRYEESDLDRPEVTADAVWVPNRNGVFVNIAAAMAEAEGCDEIVAGFNAEEAARFPDNTRAYVDAANEALRWSTRAHPRVVCYTQDLTKREIVELGRRIGAPLELVWSCYLGGPKPCGACDPCRRLQRAYREAGPG